MASDRYPFGAHERLRLIYERLAKMTRAEVAAMVVIAEHANSQTGETFVSQCTIAKRGGMTTRSATRTIAKLVNDGIIAVEPRSGRTSIIKMIKPPTLVSGLDADVPPTLVSTPPDADVGTPPTPVSDEPLSKPGTLPGLRKDGGETCSPAPVGAGSLANHGADRFPDFWQAFPVRSTVAEAEQIIAELVAAGVDLQEIIEGAKRYQKYNAATASKKRQSAKQWLTRQAWRDDWTLPAVKQKKTAPPRFNINRLQDCFTEIRLIPDIRTFNSLYDEIYQKYVEPHIWPDGKPGDDLEFEADGRQKAACPACWDRLYGYREGTACCCKPMDELADLIDDMDAWSSECLYAKTFKEQPPL